MTMKATRHMEQRETSVREWVQDKTLNVYHVKGTCNPADIFTKEMKDGVHFRRLRDSFMTRSSSFLKSPSLDTSSNLPGYSSDLVHLAQTAKSVPTSSCSGLLEVMLSSNIFRSKTSFSHLSSSGRSQLSAALLNIWVWVGYSFWSVYTFIFQIGLASHYVRSPHTYEPFSSSSAFVRAPMGGVHTDRRLTSWIAEFTSLLKSSH